MPPTSRVSQTWQFVTVNEPKKIQDKDTISTVRAHAMRSVRRKKRLELTAENQKKIEAIAQQSHPADSGVLSHHSVQVYPNDPFVGNRGKPDWLAPQREMLLKLEFLCLGHLPSNGAEYVAYDEYAQRLDYWQSDRDGDTRAAPKHFTHEISTIGSPKSLIGDGVFDPFNVMPIHGGANHNSHVLNHFVRVMSGNCLLLDQPAGQNPLKIWLPYALQDATLFLATLTFAEVHLEIMFGNYRSQKILVHKGDTINAVNTKLEDSKHAFSNETIGAVAMLAAMEAMLGNYRELRIHMNGLQRLVYMRGGSQSLGWEGILHTFISWQDLLSSAMTASAPRRESPPQCLPIQGSLPDSGPIFPELGLSTELGGDSSISFQNMRYLTQITNNWLESRIAIDNVSFSKIRADTVYRLLSAADTKPASEMSNLDFRVETCRLAALIYIKIVLHMDIPLCAMIRSLKFQLMQLIKQGEANGTIGVGAQEQPASITWALFISGITSLNRDEEEWFAQRLAKGIRASGVKTWPEMEDRLRQICWLDKMNIPTCGILWNRIMDINAENGTAQVRSVASNWDQKGPFYWYPGFEENADTSRQGLTLNS